MQNLTPGSFATLNNVICDTGLFNENDCVKVDSS